MLAINTIFIDLLRITLPKVLVKFQPHPLKIFRTKVEKVQKTHKLCIIMLIKGIEGGPAKKKNFDR